MTEQKITEWLVSEKIAENGFAAGHIEKGLKLYEVDPVTKKALTREEQEARCRLYRLWRSKTEKKESKRIPSKQAYDLAIYGLSPADVEPRQIEFGVSE